MGRDTHARWLQRMVRRCRYHFIVGRMTVRKMMIMGIMIRQAPQAIIVSPRFFSFFATRAINPSKIP